MFHHSPVSEGGRVFDTSGVVAVAVAATDALIPTFGAVAPSLRPDCRMLREVLRRLRIRTAAHTAVQHTDTDVQLDEGGVEV